MTIWVWPLAARTSIWRRPTSVGTMISSSTGRRPFERPLGVPDSERRFRGFSLFLSLSRGLALAGGAFSVGSSTRRTSTVWPPMRRIFRSSTTSVDDFLSTVGVRRRKNGIDVHSYWSADDPAGGLTWRYRRSGRGVE